MSFEQQLTPQERELEAALRSVQPRQPELDPCSIAFQLGQRSSAWRLTAWRAAAAILLVAVILAETLRPSPRTVERIVFVPTPAPITIARASYSPTPQMLPTSNVAFSYLNLRQKVIEHGLDALPASPPAAANETIPRLGSSRLNSGDNL